MKQHLSAPADVSSLCAAFCSVSAECCKAVACLDPVPTRPAPSGMVSALSLPTEALGIAKELTCIIQVIIVSIFLITAGLKHTHTHTESPRIPGSKGFPTQAEDTVNAFLPAGSVTPNLRSFNINITAGGYPVSAFRTFSSPPDPHAGFSVCYLRDTGQGRKIGPTHSTSLARQLS